MTYFVFNRSTLQLEGAFEKLSDNHIGSDFIALPLHGDWNSFRKTLDLLKVSRLELALMWRNAGNIRGPISDFRDNLISSLYYLLASGKALTKHTVTLFDDNADNGGAEKALQPPLNKPTAALKPAPLATPQGSNLKRLNAVLERETQNGVSKYKEGTGGAKIWKYFDENPSTAKEQLDKIAEANEWNKTSVSIVFRQWKRFHNVSN